MKTATLQLPLAPVAGNLNGRIEGIAAGVRRGLRSVTGAPMPMSETERILREAEARRAAFLATR